MINGFQNETAPLTDRELSVLPEAVAVLKTAYGKDKAVYNDRLQRITGLSSARIRKLINHIRSNDLVPCLMASSKGYYIAETEEEILDYEESLRGRELAIRNIRHKIAEQRAARFSKPKPVQMSLF